MAVYDLTGAGVQGLSSGVAHLFVHVLIFGTPHTIGRATPPNYYDLGLLRLGWHGAYRQVIPIDATDMYITVPDPSDVLGYSLFDVTSIRVTEDF